jgi:hypothetical protein
MKPLLFFFLAFLAFNLNAQKNPSSSFATIDAKALKLPDSLTVSTDKMAYWFLTEFNAENDRVRAVFIWIASNIKYDVANMYAINFYETDKQKIEKVLKTRAGICVNFACLFNDICRKAGIRSCVIEGYTMQNGFTDYIPHAWCAAEIDSSWFLFDPTWGSGYVSGTRFVRKINNSYFKVKPEVLIKSHMPFDYLWQFLNYPVTTQEFYDGKTGKNTTKPFFNYVDSIQHWEALDHISQLKQEASRIERNGVKNSMIFDRLQHIKMEIENDRIQSENQRQQTIVDLYNSAVNDYNEGVRLSNKFIDYRNNRFEPKKSDPVIQDMLTAARNNLKTANEKLETISRPDANTLNLMNQLLKSIADVDSQMAEQQEWLNEYFSKGKSGRKSMFYKVTWFGIPLN